jgi:glycosyltransferase involved in cell wall biosynthesis
MTACRVDPDGVKVHVATSAGQVPEQGDMDLTTALHARSSIARPPVSVMVFTLNEEMHLPDCLASVAWCDDVIVVDSFSTDRTEEISRAAGARFFTHAFEGFGEQRRWAMQYTHPKYEWILILDADERVTPELEQEMRELLADAPPHVAGYRVKRRLFMWGRWLRYSNLYPTWVVRLVHKSRVQYINRGHAETQEVIGEIRELQHDLIDENIKGIDEWFDRQNRYSSKEAEYEIELERAGLRAREIFGSDPLARRAALKRLAAKLPGRPLWYFIYAYVLRKGFLEGRDGLTFCLMKAVYQQMIQIKKYDIARRASVDRASG